jgi:hypothetical protein
MAFYRLQAWEDNIKINIKGIGWEFVGWMYLVRDGAKWGRGGVVVSTVMNI